MLKKIIFFILSLQLYANAQNAYTDYLTVASGTASNNAQIKNRTFSFGNSDTTASQDIRKFSSIAVGIQTQDTVALIIKYQLSADNSNWSALTTIDSCVQSNGTSAIKGTNLSTASLGMSYIRFVFNFTKSNVYGTTYTSLVRKYTATLKKIQ